VAHQKWILWRTPRIAGCATESSPLIFFLWRTMGVRHRNPLSVAHLAWCATEIHISVAHLPGAPQNSEKIQKIQKLQKKIKKF
jgi:hypothetical protein